jgi:hypothetical protein
MNSSRDAAETLRKLISFACILGLISTVTSAQGGANGAAAGQNAQRPAAANPTVSSAITTGAAKVRAAALGAGATPAQADAAANGFINAINSGAAAVNTAAVNAGATPAQADAAANAFSQAMANGANPGGVRQEVQSATREAGATSAQALAAASAAQDAASGLNNSGTNSQNSNQVRSAARTAFKDTEANGGTTAQATAAAYTAAREAGANDDGARLAAWGNALGDLKSNGIPSAQASEIADQFVEAASYPDFTPPGPPELTITVAPGVDLTVGRAAEANSGTPANAMPGGPQAPPARAQATVTINGVTHHPLDPQRVALDNVLERTLAAAARRKITGPWVIITGYNGPAVPGSPFITAEVGIYQAEALVLRQTILLTQLNQLLDSASALRSKFYNMTPAEKEAYVAQLRNEAIVVKQKYQKYMNLKAQVNAVPGGLLSLLGVTGGENEVRGKYNQFMAQVAQLRRDGKTAEADQMEARINDSLYGEYRKARADYYQSLGRNVLMAVQLNGVPFFEAISQNTSVEDLETKTGDYLGRYTYQINGQIVRFEGLKTIEDYRELAKPEYDQTDQVAISVYGDFGRQLMNGLEGWYEATQGEIEANQAVEDFVWAEASALPFIGLPVMVIQVFRDGNEYIIALTDEENAKTLAAVNGWQPVIAATEKREAAGEKVTASAVNAGSAIALQGLSKALQSGEGVRVEYRFRGQGGSFRLGASTAGALPGPNSATSSSSLRTGPGDTQIIEVPHTIEPPHTGPGDTVIIEQPYNVGTQKVDPYTGAAVGQKGVQTLAPNTDMAGVKANPVKGEFIPIEGDTPPSARASGAGSRGNDAVSGATGRVSFSAGAVSDGTRLTSAEANAILDRLDVRPKAPGSGGAFTRNEFAGTYAKISPGDKAFFTQNGLQPVKTVQIGNQTYHLSKPFMLSIGGEQKIVTIGFQETPNGVVPRTFYLSQSHGVFRAAPAANGIGLTISKGPVNWDTRKFVNESIVDINATDQGKIARWVNSAGVDTSLPEDVAARAAYGHLESLDSNELNHFLNPSAVGKPFVLNSNTAPNFAAGPLDYWTMDNPLYGPTEGFVYKSNDGNVTYIVLRNSNGEVWVPSIQDAKTTFTPFGTRAEAFNAPELTETPQIHGDGPGPYEPNPEFKKNQLNEGFRKNLPSKSALETSTGSSAQTPKSGDVNPVQQSKSVEPSIHSNSSLSNNRASASPGAGPASSQPNLAPAASSILKAGTSGNEPNSEKEKPKPSSNGSVGLNVQPGTTTNPPAFALANVNTGPIQIASTTGTLSILPNGLLQVTPPNGSVAYQGAFHTNDGSISLYSPGTNFSATPLPNPTFIASSPNLAGSPRSVNSDHSLAYAIPIFGLPGTSTGTSNVGLSFQPVGSPAEPILPLPGREMAWGARTIFIPNPTNNSLHVPDVSNTLLLNATNTAVNAVGSHMEQDIAVSGSEAESAPTINNSPGDSNPRSSSNRRPVSGHLELAAFPLREPQSAFRGSTFLFRRVDDVHPATDLRAAIYSIVANGNASGRAAELQVYDPTGRIKDPTLPSGTILEPVKLGSAQPVELLQPRSKIMRRRIVAYCVDYAKLPPAPGMLYRVAAPETQAQYRDVASALEASHELEAANAYTPDSDPETYKRDIAQYSLWAIIQHWTQQQFAEAFLQKIKANAAVAHVRWTQEMEKSLLALVPGRWHDIMLVEQRAMEIANRHPTQPSTAHQ